MTPRTAILSLCLLTLCGLAAPAAFAQGSFDVLGTGFVTDVEPVNWNCSASLGSNRCYITTSDPNTGTHLTQYIMNGGESVLVPSGVTNGGFVYHMVQANNKTICPAGARWDANGWCASPEGPFGTQNRPAGGDEWWIFRCPEGDPMCVSTAPVMMQDQNRRAHDAGCPMDTDPAACDKASWHIGSADYDAGSNRVRMWMDVQELGPKVTHPTTCTPTYPTGQEDVLKPKHLVFRSVGSQALLWSAASRNWDKDGNGALADFNTAFKVQGDSRWCDGSCGWTSANCQPDLEIRVSDAVLVPDPTGSRWLPNPTGGGSAYHSTDYAGFLSWIEDTSPYPGCYCCEGGPTTSCDPQNYHKNRQTFIVVEVGVGVWFAEYSGLGNIVAWHPVAWGDWLDFVPPDTPHLARRTDALELTEVNGQSKAILWQYMSPPSTVPGGGDPCALEGGSLSTYTANYGTDATNPWTNARRTLRWAFVDLGDGSLETTSTTDDKTEMGTVDWADVTDMPMPTQYRAGLVGFGYQYFEIDNGAGNCPDRFLLYGSKDRTACRENEAGTYDNATGRGVRWVELEVPGEICN